VTSSGKLRCERQYKGDAAHGMVETRRDGKKGDRVADAFAWFVGIDWGSEVHALCLLDATGQIRGTRTVAHTVEGLHDAVRWVCEQTGATPTVIAVGIETPHGALVDTVIEQGFPVFAVNPKQLDRFRDRFTAAGAKDDDRDAQALADGLRTDRRAFRRVRPDDPLIIQLREATRLREDLQADEQRLANRLREQLYRVDAAWLTLSPAADEPWLWAMLAEAPDPAAWRQLPRRRVAAVLHAHRIRRVSPDVVLEAIRQPRLTVAPGVTEAVATRIAAVVPQLQVVAEQRLATERRMDRLLEQLASREVADGELREHRDVEILQSLPGVGRMVTATMLTEATGPLADRDYPTLRAHAGAAPVTKRSGKRLRFVHMRYACKGRLRQALYHWARTSIQRDTAARAYYDTLRTRGHHHARALRSVADRWLRILVAMLKTGTLYDGTRFAQNVAEPA
jgi:transposase